MNTENTTCPLCGEGRLHERVIQEESTYKNQRGQTPLVFSECDVCGVEQTDAHQARANKRAMIAFKKSVDGLLTGREVRALRERLGINQAEAAQIFGGGPVAFSKYESDDVAQSEAMDKLLRLADELPEVLTRLSKNAGIAIRQRAVVTHTVTRSWETMRAPLTAPRSATQRPRMRVIRETPISSDAEQIWEMAS